MEQGLDFEQRLRDACKVACRGRSRLFLAAAAVVRTGGRRARSRSATRYDDVFSSCNRNFRILGAQPADRWCGQCPKCHFVFLALAPFLPKPRLLAIFGRNLLDDASLAPGFDALLEYRDHKPFECVGEGREARAAMHALTQRAGMARGCAGRAFRRGDPAAARCGDLALEPLLAPRGEHFLPARLSQRR